MNGSHTVSSAQAASGLVPVDAQVLLAHVVARDRAWLVAHRGDRLLAADAATFLDLARRRRDGEPVAYLVGFREFHGLRLAVTPAVLIPRPETESVVEMALARLPVDRDVQVLDLGTGSGAIALAIAHERPHAKVLATDVDPRALAVARANAVRLDLARVEFALADWFTGLPEAAEACRFDLIASNPPYVAAGDRHLSEGDLRFEPAKALVGGSDGLAALRTIIAGAPARLAPGGSLVVEHGYDQAEAVHALFDAAGFANIEGVRDLAGIPRVVAGRLEKGEKEKEKGARLD